MDQQKQQIVEKVKAANNVLVTVSTNPSVDQLAACIGLTLLLNKMGKHATAVFSGKVPSTIEFLKPEETIEANTDSLRDFIIAIDKSKADKLRYKVEDEVVKIFITPYKRSINEKDLVYSQGDLNVDVVLALGIAKQQDVDAAIMAHGRILHDATVVSINNSDTAEIGTINWLSKSASGVSELGTALALEVGKELLDKQISTALLTGIVAATDHFGNAKTTPQTMTVSAALLAAGANQQLVATQLGHDGQAAGVPGAQNGGPQPGNPGSNNNGSNNSGQKNDQTGKGGKGNKPGQPKAQPGNGPSGPGNNASGAAGAGSKAAKDTVPPEDSLEAILQQADEEFSGRPAASPKPAAGPVPKPEPVAAEANQPTPAPLEGMPPFEAVASEPADTSAAPGLAVETVPDGLPAVPPTPSPELDKDASSGQLDVSGGGPNLDTVELPAPAVPDAPPAGPTPPAPATSAAADLDSARKAVEDALMDVPGGPPEDLNAMPVDLGAPAADAVPLQPPANPAPPLAPPPAVPGPGLPDYLTTPSMAPPAAPPLGAPAPAVSHPTPPLPLNPAVNEQAPLQGSPADQPVTMPLPPSGGAMPPAGFATPAPGAGQPPVPGAAPPGGLNVPPPLSMPPTSTGLPPQGPPPPPAPPPMIHHGF